MANAPLLLSIAVQSTPIVGDAYSALTGMIGYDPIAGVSLSETERALALGSAAVIGGGFHLFARVADKVADGARLGRAGDAGAGARGLPPGGGGGGGGAELRWVDEGGDLRTGVRGPGMSDEAYDYQSSAAGARSNVASWRASAPQVVYTDAAGNRVTAKFDGMDDEVLVDRKVSVFTSRKTADLARRQSEGLSALGRTGRWEVATLPEARRAIKLFESLGINNMTVRVVPLQ